MLEIGKERMENGMDKEQAEQRIKALRGELEYHSDRYYNQDNPEISDYLRNRSKRRIPVLR